jgi:hypothetical protein
MPFIVNKDNKVQFRYEIECKCGSTNCDQYIAELSPNPRESDLAIRYRCLDCGNIYDVEE